MNPISDHIQGLQKMVLLEPTTLQSMTFMRIICRTKTTTESFMLGIKTELTNTGALKNNKT